VLIGKTHLYAESVRSKEKRFIPNPSTWFNQERWKDPIQADDKYQTDGRRIVSIDEIKQNAQKCLQGDFNGQNPIFGKIRVPSEIPKQIDRT
jgi:hypothetical protein